MSANTFPASDVRIIKDEKHRTIQIVVGNERRLLTLGEWSRLIANPEEPTREDTLARYRQ